MKSVKNTTFDFRRVDAEALNQQLKRAQSMGHVFRTEAIYSGDSDTKGIEFFLDSRIVPNQIRKIVHHIVEKYNFDAYYYTKTHSVKVWYRSARQ